MNHDPVMTLTYFTVISTRSSMHLNVIMAKTVKYHLKELGGRVEYQ